MAVAESASVSAADLELRECLERMLSEKGTDAPAIAAIDRACSEDWGSYDSEVLTVHFAGGTHLRLFLKDFGRSKLPKDAPAERRERERCAYEQLLDGEELGTARFYGARWDEAAARFWLVLEFVDGEPLRYCGFEHWLEAAAWLGRLHGGFAGQRERLRTCDFLIRHDTEFFLRAAGRALRALSRLDEPLALRLASVLEGYAQLLPVLTRDSDTLVHGSYRPQNVVVSRSSTPTRICPTDWELAAFGRSTYDLAFVCDGFRPPRLDALFDAYEREAQSFGLPARDRAELRHEVECFRLHKTISSLGDVHLWERPVEIAAKVVGTAEEIAATLA